MKIILPMLLLVCLLAQPAAALELEAPAVPKSGEALMPKRAESFGEGLWQITKAAVGLIHPDLREAANLCLTAFGMMLLCSLFMGFTGVHQKTGDMVGAVALGSLLLKGTQSMIQLGTRTVTEITEYGRLLLPVMTAAMAAQGGVTSSAALYGGTALFLNVLGSMIANILIPVVYLYLALAVAHGALGDELLKKGRDFLKWLGTWCLKTILYIFTGYMGITGVVSGTTDAAALKAAKLTISGVVPVVGGSLSDASEAVLVGAGVVKNTAGVYGILAVAAVCIGPFLKIGVHYLLLKFTALLAGIVGSKRMCGLVEDFSGAMGMVLAMTGSVCLLVLISTVCFLKGVG
jgi:stage III sporulation protein AE